MPEDPVKIRRIIERSYFKASALRFGDFLLGRRLVTNEQLSDVRHIQLVEVGKLTGKIMVERNLLTEEQLTEALEEYSELQSARREEPVWPAWRSLRHKIIENLGRGKNVFLYGPWGSSKTFMLQQVCDDLKSQVPETVLYYEEYTSVKTMAQDLLRRFKENGADIRRYGQEPGAKISQQEAVEWCLYALRKTDRQYYLTVDSKGGADKLPKRSTIGSLAQMAASPSLSLLTCAQMKYPELVSFYAKAEVSKMPGLNFQEARVFIKHILSISKDKLHPEVKGIVTGENKEKREAYVSGLINMSMGRPGVIRELITNRPPEEVITRKYSKLEFKGGEAHFLEMKWFILIIVVAVMASRGAGTTLPGHDARIATTLAGAFAWLFFWIIMRIGGRFGQPKT